MATTPEAGLVAALAGFAGKPVEEAEYAVSLAVLGEREATRGFGLIVQGDTPGQRLASIEQQAGALMGSFGGVEGA